MTRNVQEVLGVGEKLDRKPYLLICSLIRYGFLNQQSSMLILFLFFNAEVSEMSSRLTSESRVYADKAKDLNRQVSLMEMLALLMIMFSL